MRHALLVTADASADLDEIHAYIAKQDGLTRADRIVDGIEGRLSRLAEFPLTGEYPSELLAWGIRDFRQVHHKPYRMIYRVENRTVYVLLVADGRRDIRALLQRRLLS